MKAFKGCINIDCQAYKKKHYRKEDSYCTICGARLQYVCANCWKQLEDSTVRYCVICQAKLDDKKDKRKENVKKVVGVAMAAGPTMVKVAKNLKEVEQASRYIKGVGGKVIHVIAKK